MPAGRSSQDLPMNDTSQTLVAIPAPAATADAAAAGGVAGDAAVAPDPTSGAAGRELYRRQALPVRVMHWINVVALTLMLLSGLCIFNSHPALYWGQLSYSGRPAWLEIGAREDAQGHVSGYTRILGHEFD